ncbi:MAG: hypothetical protein MUO26_01405 [Methanotrichaceae archaeon]|nr:hypothetical protein [Methanotrichaceae archaeon]
MSAILGMPVILGSGIRHDSKMEHASHEIPQGLIELDSDFAKEIKFISSRFLSCSYLWGEGNRIIINALECTDRRKGYLRDLFKAIWDLGAEIAVRTPLGAMEQILMHYGFARTFVTDPIYGKTELWLK